MDVKTQIYEPIKQLKQRFYECQSNDDWQKLKEELKSLLALAKENMDAKFYEQYSQGIINSITKIYSYKEKQFNKPQYKAQPKQSYIFRPEEGEAFIKLANALADFLTIKIKSHETE